MNKRLSQFIHPKDASLYKINLSLSQTNAYYVPLGAHLINIKTNFFNDL